MAELQKVLAREGVLGIAPLRVSAQAITKLLDVMPAAMLGQLLVDVCVRLQARTPVTLPHPSSVAVQAQFSQLAIVDGSTLEALRKKTAVLWQREGLVLAGSVMVMVEAFSHRPLWQLFAADAAANDTRFAAEILVALPVRGLLIFDLGCFSFLWFDAFTDRQQYLVTRMREKTAYRTGQVLSQGPYDGDEHMAVGQYLRTPVSIRCGWSRCGGRGPGLVI